MKNNDSGILLGIAAIALIAFANSSSSNSSSNNVGKFPFNFSFGNRKRKNSFFRPKQVKRVKPIKRFNSRIQPTRHSQPNFRQQWHDRLQYLDNADFDQLAVHSPGKQQKGLKRIFNAENIENFIEKMDDKLNASSNDGGWQLF